ncbi:hypothetical protein ACUNWD_07005 [Sunxiuqinia sp. A32]|uniref:hypothetical protein n=1 Tax=Sunxiuqinia sp. A32 TaxID=3461496 RepID=UPI0040458008
MVVYQITYINKHPQRSDRARMAIDLKKIYWQDCKLPKDWYWFEGNISIVSVADRETDCVKIECLLLQDPFDNDFIKELKKNKDIDCIAYEQGDDFYVTVFSRFP